MKVQSAVRPKETKILGNRVLVRSNITEKQVTNDMTEETHLMYEYDEEVYPKDDYIEKMDEENATMQQAIDDLIFSGGAL